MRDTGIGIAADQLEHVFDMFTQVDTSLERSLTGLGIGLTLVKTLTEMHGGTRGSAAAAVSVREASSSSDCRLPWKPTHRHPGPWRPGRFATTPLRILIVDDNRDSADMLATLLQFAGHETFAAHDGLAAVEAAARLDPDVILLDIGLPVLNGYEAARRIREQQGQKRRPLLVALTGWGQDEDRRRSEEAGFDAHLVKPVDRRSPWQTSGRAQRRQARGARLIDSATWPLTILADSGRGPTRVQDGEVRPRHHAKHVVLTMVESSPDLQ